MRKGIKALVEKYGLEDHMVDYIEYKYDEIIDKYGSIEEFTKDFKEV